MIVNNIDIKCPKWQQWSDPCVKSGSDGLYPIQSDVKFPHGRWAHKALTSPTWETSIEILRWNACNLLSSPMDDCSTDEISPGMCPSHCMRFQASQKWPLRVHTITGNLKEKKGSHSEEFSKRNLINFNRWIKKFKHENLKYSNAKWQATMVQTRCRVTSGYV